MEVVVARFSGTIPASAQGLTKPPKTVWTAGLLAEIQICYKMYNSAIKCSLAHRPAC
jgi:hypothetical protein